MSGLGAGPLRETAVFMRADVAVWPAGVDELLERPGILGIARAGVRALQPF